MKSKINVAHVGLHVVVKRQFAGIAYWHHGILVGEGSVIHYTSSFSRGVGEIKRVKLRTFAGGKRVYVFPSAGDRPDLILKRAFKRLGEKTYSVTDNNCEHFAYYCRTGEKRSLQKRDVLHLAAMAALTPVSAAAAAVSAAITIYDHYQLEDKLTPLAEYQKA